MEYKIHIVPPQAPASQNDIVVPEAAHPTTTLQHPTATTFTLPWLRCSHRATLIGLGAILLALGGVMWYLGYRASTPAPTLEQLLGLLRTQVPHSVIRTVQTQINKPLYIVNTLYSLLQLNGARNASHVDLDQYAGAMNALRLLQHTHTDVVTQGFALSSGLGLVLTQETPDSDPDTQKHIYTLCANVTDAQQARLSSFKETEYAWDDAAILQPLSMARIRSWPLLLIQSGVDFRRFEWYMAGQRMNGTVGYSRMYSWSSLTQDNAIAAVRAHLSSTTGEVVFVAFSSLRMSVLQTTLSALNEQIQQAKGLIMVWDLRTTRLVVSTEGGDIGTYNTSTTLHTIVHTTPWSTDATTLASTYTYHNGRSYYLTGVLVERPGLRWLVLILTDAAAIESSSSQAQLSILIVTAVLFSTMACVLLAFSWCMDRPLRRLAAVMSRLANLLGRANDLSELSSPRHVKLYAEIKEELGRWHTRQANQWACGVTRCMHEIHTLEVSFHSLIDRLIVSYEQLERAHQAKQQFIRYIFHEVRVPLGAVILALGELRHAARDIPADLTTPSSTLAWTDDHKDLVETSYLQVQVVANILNAVLNLRKIEDGALKLEMVPFSLCAMILNTMHAFKTEIAQKRLIYTADLDSLHEHYEKLMSAGAAEPGVKLDVIGDKYRLRQVLSNLITNAMKFTPPGGAIELSMRIASITPPSSNLLLPRRLSTTHESPELRATFLTLEHATAAITPNAPDLISGVVTAAPSSSSSSSSSSLLARLQRAPKVKVRISVRDTGIGLAKSDIHKLFQPYMQVLPGQQQQGKGTGLGLNISQRLMQLHEGSLSYEEPNDGRGGAIFHMDLILPVQPRAPQHTQNAPQQTDELVSPDDAFGETPYNPHLTRTLHLPLMERVPSRDFPSDISSTEELSDTYRHLYIPQERAHSEPDTLTPEIGLTTTHINAQQRLLSAAASAVASAADSSSPSTTAGARILVVEDCNTTRKLLCRQLHRNGYQTVVAENGQEAIELLLPRAGLPPAIDVILMDSNMPVLCGIPATKHLRLNRVVTPIVGVTGNAMDNDVREFLDAGANQVLTKPVSEKILQQTIRRFILPPASSSSASSS